MLNSLLKLLLAKFGLATLSNWVGFTQRADEGMNLLQRWGLFFLFPAGIGVANGEVLG